jgi:hypothetical protein
MIAQRHVDGGYDAKLFEKAKEMRESFGNVEQVPGDENPIRMKLPHGVDDAIVTWAISVNMQVGDMDGTTSQATMHLRVPRHLMLCKAKFPVGDETE